MTYFCILLTRYNPSFDFNLAFTKSLHIPKGPGQFLLLDRPYFKEPKDRGKMVDTFEIDENEIEKVRSCLYCVVWCENNIVYYEYCLKSTRWYHDRFWYLKGDVEIGRDGIDVWSKM